MDPVVYKVEQWSFVETLMMLQKYIHCSTLYTTGSTPYTGFNITSTTRYSKTYLRKNNWKTIILNYWSQFTQSLSTNLYLNETLLISSQQGRTVKRWELYLTINHLLSTTYNSRCNWLQYYLFQVAQNTRIMVLIDYYCQTYNIVSNCTILTWWRPILTITHSLI